MRTIRTITAVAIAAGTLALGSAALAQDAQKPEAKPQAEAKQEHRGEHHRHGMSRMREMRGGCHGEAHGSRNEKPGQSEKHDHS